MPLAPIYAADQLKPASDTPGPDRGSTIRPNADVDQGVGSLFLPALSMTLDGKLKKTPDPLVCE